MTQIKLWLAGIVTVVLGAFVAYHKWVVARKKALEKELENTQAAREVERKVVRESAKLEVRQAQRRQTVSKKKATRRQGLGAGRRDEE